MGTDEPGRFPRLTVHPERLDRTDVAAPSTLGQALDLARRGRRPDPSPDP